MNIEVQAKHICHSVNFQLRNIHMISDLVTAEAAEQLHSLIMSHLDYCNSLLYRLAKVQTWPLQRV